MAPKHGPRASYVNLWVVHAPVIPGTFSPPPRVIDPDMHHGTCVTHVPWCMPGSITSAVVSSEVGGGENVPDIPGASTTRNLTCLVRSPWKYFLHRWPFGRAIHVDFLQWGSVMVFCVFSLLLDWTNCWTSCRVAPILIRRYCNEICFAVRTSRIFLYLILFCSLLTCDGNWRDP